MVKVLCVHGVGHQEANLDWQDNWKDAIRQGVRTGPAGVDADVEFRFTNYDDLFEPVVNALSAADIASAVNKLVGGVFGLTRGLADVTDAARWTAGMVVAWVENDVLRQEAWEAFLKDVEEFQPDLVCAHSLGTLISYDGFSREPDKISRLTYMTFGSQLGNLFVRGAFGGRVPPFDGAAGWYHLYNHNDHVFTAPLDFGDFRTANNFNQVETPFGSFLPFPLNHDPVNPTAPNKAYLTHPETEAAVWPVIPVAAAAPLTRVLKLAAKVVEKVPDAPKHRALLVGINNYPDPANRLEGCVNDVFLMSSVLQECGFAAEDVRVVLDDRATADGIVERLHWLLDGTAAGDQRFFYYSGHGALLPAYAADGKVRHVDACLVPWDFAWTRETAITDDRLLDFYSQLPYEAQFMMVLDSCHSGGMTRGGARARGLEPPDDIRHRMLRWNSKLQMWEARQLPPANEDLSDTAAGKRFTGASGSMRLLGRAVALRTLPNKEYDKVRDELDHKGPYLPMIYEACREEEFAYEYKHGVISHGAFTYALAAILRRHGVSGQPVTFAKLLDETGDALKDLHYEQHPALVGPTALLKKPLPWEGLGKKGKK